MILTDQQIVDAVEKGEVKLTDFGKFREQSLQPASYDLHLGHQGLTSKRRQIIDIAKEGLLLLEPGEFGIVMTHEVLEFSDRIVGHFGLRSFYTRKGLTTFGGIQVDPGFKGRLKIGLYNLSPNDIAIGYLDPFCTLELHRLSEPVKNPYRGPYQGEETIKPEDLQPVLQAKGMTFGEVLATLGNLSKQMQETNLAIKGLTSQFKTAMWVYGSGLAIIAILIGLR